MTWFFSTPFDFHLDCVTHEKRVSLPSLRHMCSCCCLFSGFLVPWSQSSVVVFGKRIRLCWLLLWWGQWSLPPNPVTVPLFVCTSAYICCCPSYSFIRFCLFQSIILYSLLPHVKIVVPGFIESNVTCYSLHVRAPGGLVWLCLSSVADVDVVKQVLANFNTEAGWEE